MLLWPPLVGDFKEYTYRGRFYLVLNEENKRVATERVTHMGKVFLKEEGSPEIALDFFKGKTINVRRRSDQGAIPERTRMG